MPYFNDKSYLDNLLKTQGEGLSDARSAIFKQYQASIEATQRAAAAANKAEENLRNARKAIDICLGRCQGQAQVLAMFARADGEIVDEVDGPEQLGELLGGTVTEILPTKDKAS